MDNYPFKQTLLVPDYDCDAFLRLKASSALRYMQRIGTMHLETLNLCYERLLEDNILFMLAAVALKFYRAPIANEEITLLTSPIPGKGAQMLREIVFYSSAGELLIEGQASWVMLNPQTQKLLKGSDFPYPLPVKPQPYTPFSNPLKIRFNTLSTNHITRQVKYSDIDRNIHMNNTIYADVICDTFGEELLNSQGIDELYIRYRSQARLGDVMDIGFGCDEENICTMSAYLGDSLCFEGKLLLK